MDAVDDEYSMIQGSDFGSGAPGLLANDPNPYVSNDSGLFVTQPPDPNVANVSVLDDGRYTWEGGLGTVWSNVPSQDLTVVVLTQRAADESGMPAVCDDVLAAARGTR